MTDTIRQRACALAVYIIETKGTVRSAARHFGISKSTVHKDLSQRLPFYDLQLYENVRTVLDTNKAQRHIRGGIATKEKYRKRRSAFSLQSC
jgi:putative DeoR family transcriptional regulator (stage III sporulation protein D)